MREIRTTIDIEAPPLDVWNVLMDFERYDEWNPFIRSIEGRPTVGEVLEVVLEADGKKPMHVSPRVTDFEMPTRFAWLGSIGFKGIFDGRHHFELVAIDGGTRLVHYEAFSGALVPIVFPTMRTSTTRGFESMNRVLKERVEAKVRGEAS